MPGWHFWCQNPEIWHFFSAFGTKKIDLAPWHFFGTFSGRLAPKKSIWHLGIFLALFFLNSLKRRLYSEILINLKFSPNVVVPSPSVEENENIGADGEANFCALRSRLNQNKPQAQAPAHSTAADQRPNIQAAELEGIYCKLAITVSINF